VDRDLNLQYLLDELDYFGNLDLVRVGALLFLALVVYQISVTPFTVANSVVDTG
jgi:hypothetical protein